MPQTPSVIVFDVNETLLDITVLEPLFARLFSDASVIRQWFAELILQSEALTLSGLYVRFNELAAGVLRMVGDVRGGSVQTSDVEELGTRLRTMPAHPDAAPALAMLKQAGFRLVTLTNSPPSAAPSPLEQADLASFFDRTYSVDQIRRFKPAPETYRMVAEGEGVLPADLCLVACHVWDTVGAQAAGCFAGLVERPGMRCCVQKASRSRMSSPRIFRPLRPRSFVDGGGPHSIDSRWAARSIGALGWFADGPL